MQTFYPTKIQFNGQHHVRPYKKSHKLKPSRPPPIPPFISEEMTQAIFLDGPQFAASSSNSLRRPPTSGKSRPRTKTERPFLTDPTVASTTTTLDPDTTTYFINSSLVDLTGDSGGNAVPAFKDAASTPSDESVKDYLVPPLPSAISEYARYNVGSTSSRKPPFKVLRVKKNRGNGKARFRGPTSSPNLLFGESQNSNVYRSPPIMMHPGMGKIPTSYKPVNPNQPEFLRYMMPQASSVVNTPYPRFPPYNFEGENDVKVQRPRGKGNNKKKQLRPSYVPAEFFSNYNASMPTTSSTVLVPDEQGWMPIHNPYVGGHSSYHPTRPSMHTTPMPQFLGPFPFPFDSRRLPNPSPSASPMPIYISAQPENERPTDASNPVITTSATPTTTQQIGSAASIKNQTTTKSTPVTKPSPNKQPETTVEIQPSIESPTISSQANNPISEFNAEYFLQQVNRNNKVDVYAAF